MGAPSAATATVPVAGSATVLASQPDAPQPAAAHDPGELSPGSLVGPRYEIVRLLGKGGMGAVYLAHDRELGRDVALKVIAGREGADGDEALERFRREIHLSTIVTHPNVLRVYDLGESDGIRFLTMQYIEGRSLAGVLAEDRPLPLERAVSLFRQICEGLAAAHANGVLHRDLKPQNVMVDPNDHAFLTDFGLATSDALSTMTRAGALMGTPQYMSPEQVKGLPVDGRSDLFSVGVMFYEMLAGTQPYTGDTVFEIMVKRTLGPPRPLRELNPAIPVMLQKLVARCLAIEPELRYASVKDVLADLDAGTVHVPVLRRVLHPRLWSSKARAGLGIAVVLAVLIATALVASRLSPSPVGTRATRTVLVGDFDNRTGESVFNGTLEPVLTVALEGASFITTLNRGNAQRVAALLQLEGEGLPEKRARLVAQREGVGIVTSGYVDREANGYRVGVRVVDAFTGQRILEQAEEIGSRDAALAAVTKLAARVRNVLGDATPVGVQLKEGDTFSARSLEAAHEYGLGTKLALEGSWDEARRHYLQAVQLDPGLARAYSGLAVLESNRGRRAEADAYFKSFMANVDRMSERERYRSRGAFYLHSRDPDQAIAAFEALIRQFPADYAGHANLALAYTFKREFAKALPEARRAIAIYPGNVPQRNNVGFFAMYAGDFDEAMREQQKVIEQNPTFGNGYIGLALAQLAAGQRDAALSTWERYRALGGADASYAAEGIADLALYEGRISDAVALLEPWVERDVAEKANDSAARKLVMLAEAHRAIGQDDRSAAAAERALSVSGGDYVVFGAAMVLARLGHHEVVRARAIADDLDKRLEPELRMYAALIRGAVELARRNYADAVEHDKSAVQRLDSWLSRFALGRAFFEAGALPQAQDELEKCEKRRGEATDVFIDNVPTYRLYPLVRYYLARTHAALGSPAGAAESYRAFLAMKRGDEDPYVPDARRRLAGR